MLRDPLVFQEWLRVVRQTIQAIPHMAGTQALLETSVARGLGRSLNEEEVAIVGFFCQGNLHSLALV